MASTELVVTTPRFHILSADLITVEKTLYLPMPTKEGISLEWIRIGDLIDLADGSKRQKVKGYSPKVTIKYKIYNDVAGESDLPIGTDDGQIPLAEDLVSILTQYGQSRLEFSPSTNSPFFRCLITKIPTLTPSAANIAMKDFQIEISGRDVFPIADLGSTPSQASNTSVAPITTWVGPVGPAGANGEKGEKGDKGDQGQPGTLAFTATLPLRSTGGTNPVVSIDKATTTTDGYISSADWNTFNGKASLGANTFTENQTLSKSLIVNGTTASTSTTTGALIVAGGVGVSGAVYAASFTGSGAGLTNIPNAALANSSVTIGSTAISLGGTSASLAGINTLSFLGTGYISFAGSTVSRGIQFSYGSLGSTYSNVKTVLGSNVYINPSDTVSDQVRIKNTHSTYGYNYYSQGWGTHTWYGAAGSVTADAVVTPTTQMTLSPTGLAVVGTITGTSFNLITGLSSTNPVMNGTVAIGTLTTAAKADHVHPTDTSRAALASPTFTGIPNAPTASVDTNTTQLATTAFVIGQGYLKTATASSTYAPLSSPTFTGTVIAPTVDSTASGTLNLGITNASTVNLGTASTTQTINIGTGSGTTTINLGGSGDTVNIAGTLTYVNTTDLNVADKLITLNKGGASGSGNASGIQIEENSTITGAIAVGTSRKSWSLKAPGLSGSILLTPSSVAYSTEIISSATANRQITLPDVTGTVWTSGNDGDSSTLDADLLDGQHGSYYKAYDLSGFCNGVPAASAVVLYIPIVRASTFQSSFTGSVGVAKTAATASTTFTIKRNGTAIGTMIFAASGTTATFTLTGSASNSVGDIVSVEAPSTQDATLANIGFTIYNSLT